MPGTPDSVTPTEAQVLQALEYSSQHGHAVPQNTELDKVNFDFPLSEEQSQEKAKPQGSALENTHQISGEQILGSIFDPKLNLNQKNPNQYHERPALPTLKQFTNYPQTCRIKKKVIRQFDLSIPDDIAALENLNNEAVKEYTNIMDLKYHSSFAQNKGTYVLLASYNIYEFQHPEPQ